MMKTLSIYEIIKELKTSDFMLSSKMPMGYTAGFPVLRILNGSLCVTVPYLKYQVTGEVDRTLVFPLRYAVTLELPTLNIAAFENYEYRPEFREINFDQPAGYFRHEAIKGFSRKKYKETYREMMNLYDKLICALLGQGPYTAEDEQKFSELLKIMVEPSLLPMYEAIDRDFFSKYLAKG